MPDTLRISPYCVGCLPALHAPIYAAVATGQFRDAGLEIQMLPEAPGDIRMQRLHDGTADLALMDLASFVDMRVHNPTSDARCHFVLTQRLPMGAHTLADTDYPEPMPTEQLGSATYGGSINSPFVAEHRALLRRLGMDDPSLLVDMEYDDLFGALARGDVDVAPDYGGTAMRFARAADPRPTTTVPYRDCGVDAYGIGFVASTASRRHRPDALRTACQVVANAYVRMRDDPDGVLDDAAVLLPGLDREYALAEWQEEESSVIFGYGAATAGIGHQDMHGWDATCSWRREVTQCDASVDPESLFNTP